MQMMFAKKVSLAVMGASALMMFGASMSGAGQLLGPAGTVFAGALIALAIAENNPRD